MFFSRNANSLAEIFVILSYGLVCVVTFSYLCNDTDRSNTRKKRKGTDDEASIKRSIAHRNMELSSPLDDVELIDLSLLLMLLQVIEIELESTRVHLLTLLDQLNFQKDFA